LYSLPETAPPEAQQKITADCKKARNEAGKNKVSSLNKVSLTQTPKTHQNCSPAAS